MSHDEMQGLEAERDASKAAADEAVSRLLEAQAQLAEARREAEAAHVSFRELFLKLAEARRERDAALAKLRSWGYAEDANRQLEIARAECGRLGAALAQRTRERDEAREQERSSTISLGKWALEFGDFETHKAELSSLRADADALRALEAWLRWSRIRREATLCMGEQSMNVELLEAPALCVSNENAPTLPAAIRAALAAARGSK